MTGTPTVAGNYGFVVFGSNSEGVGVGQSIQIEVISAGFDNWTILDSLPADRRGAFDRRGPLQIQNLRAYAMGLNPLTATTADLPHVGGYDPEAETVTFRYRRATDTPGTTLKPVVSTDLDDWQDADTGSLTVLETHDVWEQVELTLPAPPGGRLFLRLEAQEAP